MVMGALLIPPKFPKMETEVSATTTLVETVNVAETAPGRTVIDGGTVADGLVVERETTAPPGGAKPSRATDPRTGFPPTTEVAFKATDISLAGITVSRAEALVPIVPVMVT